MKYCNSCGAVHPDDAMVCKVCGFSFGPVAANAVPEEGAKAEMSLEESIKLADKLKTQYAEVINLTRKIAEAESTLSRPSYGYHKRYSRFRFLWPYLLAAVIGASIGYALGLVGIIAYVIAIGVVITGFAVSGKKQEEANIKASQIEEAAKNHLKELNAQHDTNVTRLNSLNRKLAEYNGLIPECYRNELAMKRVSGILKSGQAGSFTEALAML